MTARTVAEDCAAASIDVARQRLDGPANESTETLTVTAVDQRGPRHGVPIARPTTGKVRYTPTDPNYNGSDSFTYTVSDNGTTNGVNDFESDTATVTITVTEVNDAPIAGR